jgi:hypothetical protein
MYFKWSSESPTIVYERYDLGDHPNFQLFSCLENSLTDKYISEVETTLVPSHIQSCLTAIYLTTMSVTQSIELSLCLTKHYAMKTYEGVHVQIQIFLTLALVTDEWSASRPSCFTSWERAPVPNVR